VRALGSSGSSPVVVVFPHIADLGEVPKGCSERLCRGHKRGVNKARSVQPPVEFAKGRQEEILVQPCRKIRSMTLAGSMGAPRCSLTT
jgi:hypothetical protein